MSDATVSTLPEIPPRLHQYLRDAHDCCRGALEATARLVQLATRVHEVRACSATDAGEVVFCATRIDQCTEEFVTEHDRRRRMGTHDADAVGWLRSGFRLTRIPQRAISALTGMGLASAHEAVKALAMNVKAAAWPAMYAPPREWQTGTPDEALRAAWVELAVKVLNCRPDGGWQMRGLLALLEAEVVQAARMAWDHPEYERAWYVAWPVTVDVAAVRSVMVNTFAGFDWSETEERPLVYAANAVVVYDKTQGVTADHLLELKAAMEDVPVSRKLLPEPAWPEAARIPAVPKGNHRAPPESPSPAKVERVLKRLGLDEASILGRLKGANDGQVDEMDLRILQFLAKYAHALRIVDMIDGSLPNAKTLGQRLRRLQTVGYVVASGKRPKWALTDAGRGRLRGPSA
jgi:hypothetical protein